MGTAIKLDGDLVAQVRKIFDGVRVDGPNDVELICSALSELNKAFGSATVMAAVLKVGCSSRSAVVLPFTGKMIPAIDVIEREVEGEEAAHEVRRSEDFDVEQVGYRAKAVKGALSTLDYAPLTGSQFWAETPEQSAREVYYDWALKAKETIDSIVASWPGAAP